MSVLDELRDAYAICKREGSPELQSMLLKIRRKLLEALHESLNLYSENAELHQQLSEAQAHVAQLLRTSGAHGVGEDAAAERPTRKLS